MLGSRSGDEEVYHARNLTKRVLQDVDMKVGRGDALAVLGANGAGKSTLMKIISGVEHPTSGFVGRGGLSVSWPIGYSSCFQSSLTGADNARFIARIYRRDVGPLLDFVEDFAQLGPIFASRSKPIRRACRRALPLGFRSRSSSTSTWSTKSLPQATLASSSAAHEALMYRRRTGTLIMVSHSAATLRTFCTRGAVLNDGRLTFYDDLEEAISVHESSQGAAA